MKNLNLYIALFCLFVMFYAYGETEVFIPEPGMTIGTNYIVFEAEATTSPLGNWEIVTPDDSRYKNNSYFPPINETHLEFTGNNPSVGNANSPLEYTFECPKTGSYGLGGRLYQRLEGQTDDKCNDVYIKMAGDFTSGNSVTTSQLKQNQKFFGRGVDSWGALYAIEVGEHQGPAVYNLKEGELYTLTISGRAQRTNVDYWLLYETSLPITVQGHQDLMGVNSAEYRPIIYDCASFSAVDMIFTDIDGFIDAKTDSKGGMDILQVEERLAWAAAQMIFQGTSGDASFTLNTLQETDGESNYRLRLNGNLIAEVTNDRIYGSDIPDYTVQSHIMNAAKVPLNHGDTLQVEFQNTTNGLVPEGELSATARGRWLSLDICTSGSFAQYYFTFNSDSVALQIQDSTVLVLDRFLPYNIDQTVVWSSLDPEIASVDIDGKLRAVKSGNTSIVAKTPNGEYVAECKIYVYQSLPFAGVPTAIPGVIEAENYDLGGEGMAYHDNLPYNVGNVFRQNESVDLEACSDGGYNIRSTEAGEWLLYTIEVDETADYAFHASVATMEDGLQFSVELDGESLLDKVNVKNTGGVKNFSTEIINDVSLSKGKHVLRLYFETGGINISWMGFFLPDTEFKVNDISINSNTFRLDADEIKQLEATVLPVVALDKSIQWSSSDTVIAEVDSTGLVTGRNQGKTYIKATSQDGLVADSVQVQVFGYSGIETLESYYEVFPNPSNGTFTIELHQPMMANFTLYNLTGSEVCRGDFDSSTQVKLEYYDTGVYLLDVSTTQGRLVQRVILR